jgi:hypothetical protein
MKVNLNMINSTVKENILIKIETYMKVNLKMIKEMVKENIHILVEE